MPKRAGSEGWCRASSKGASTASLVVPDGPAHLLPAYELALLTAEQARRAGVAGLELALVTPEPFPLAAFGGAAGAVVGSRLRGAGVEVYASATAFAPARDGC